MLQKQICRIAAPAGIAVSIINIITYYNNYNDLILYGAVCVILSIPFIIGSFLQSKAVSWFVCLSSLSMALVSTYIQSSNIFSVVYLCVGMSSIWALELIKGKMTFYIVGGVLFIIYFIFSIQNIGHFVISINISIGYCAMGIICYRIIKYILQNKIEIIVQNREKNLKNKTNILLKNLAEERELIRNQGELLNKYDNLVNELTILLRQCDD